jgi:hypothetical protein
MTGVLNLKKGFEEAILDSADQAALFPNGDSSSNRATLLKVSAE